MADWSSAGPFVRPEELLMLPPKVAASRVVFHDVALRRNLGEAMAKPSPSWQLRCERGEKESMLSAS